MEPALCLTCGKVLQAGNKMGAAPAPHSMSSSSALGPIAGVGECTVHSRLCGAGTGLFLLVQQHCVLALRGSRAVYLPALYVDEHGEPPDGHRGQSRPLFLSRSRYRRLRDVVLKHQLGRDVARIRASDDRRIRLNYY